jgi:hypothetical protein
MTIRQPLCKVCGKPVPKITQRISFGCRHADTHSFAKHVVERPADLAEAIRLAGDGEVIRVTKGHFYGQGADAPEGAITELTLWHGEYAWGGHFHAQTCAAEFGLGMANQFPDHAMPAYREAVAAQKERA